MYPENEYVAKQDAAIRASGQLGSISSQDRTIGENLDQKINYLQSELDRLKSVKEQMLRGVPLLQMKASDLRRAMDY